MAVVHLCLQPLANNSDRFEALDVSSACHDQAHGQSANAKAIFLGLFIDQVFGLVRVNLVQEIGRHLCGNLGPLELIDEVVDELEGRLVACPCVLVAQGQVCSSLDIDIAKGNAGEIEAFATNLLAVFLFDSRDVMCANEADDLWYLALDPGLRGSDFIPKNEAATEHLLKQERGPD